MCACERCGTTENTSKYVDEVTVSDEVEALSCEMVLCPACAADLAKTSRNFDDQFSAGLFGNLTRVEE